MDSSAKGRVVMLVDNDVERDSRVQKQARSMADAGWDVTLLGTEKPNKPPRAWTLGGAKVRLISMPKPLLSRPNDLRRARLRAPLAYPIGWLAESRRQAVRARKADLRVRRIAARHPSEGNEPAAAPVHLFPLRAAARILESWVELRANQTDKLTARRSEMNLPLDRLTTAFWQRTMGNRSWRRLDPHLWDYELAFGPEIDRVQPDIIHANDFRMLGVGARAVVRAREHGRAVKLVWDAHEFLPGIMPWAVHPRWHEAQIAHEREYASAADHVVTVSDELAEMLQEAHSLPEKPTVVLNTPYANLAAEHAHQPTIREVLGVGEDVPVMVYSGSASPARGLEVMIEALPQLPDVVCALVVSRHESTYVRSLVARARELGVRDRVHLLSYVPFDQVVPFLSTADVGVIPIDHWPNHEIALITKFFEYSHARLPIVVSDVRAMSHMTRSTGQGEVFEAGNCESFVSAVGMVLKDPDRYRAAYDPELLNEWTWETQAEVLDAVYTRVMSK